MKGKDLLDKITDIVLAYKPVRKKKKRKTRKSSSPKKPSNTKGRK
jgi:hypothetical protein